MKYIWCYCWKWGAASAQKVNKNLDGRQRFDLYISANKSKKIDFIRKCNMGPSTASIHKSYKHQEFTKPLRMFIEVGTANTAFTCCNVNVLLCFVRGSHQFAWTSNRLILYSGIRFIRATKMSKLYPLDVTGVQITSLMAFWGKSSFWSHCASIAYQAVNAGSLLATFPGHGKAGIVVKINRWSISLAINIGLMKCLSIPAFSFSSAAIRRMSVAKPQSATIKCTSLPAHSLSQIQQEDLKATQLGCCQSFPRSHLWLAALFLHSC